MLMKVVTLMMMCVIKLWIGGMIDVDNVGGFKGWSSKQWIVLWMLRCGAL